MTISRNLSFLAEGASSAGVLSVPYEGNGAGVVLTTTGSTNYLGFFSATSGNLPQLVNSSITVNAVNGTITGGIAGGSF